MFTGKRFWMRIGSALYELWEILWMIWRSVSQSLKLGWIYLHHRVFDYKVSLVFPALLFSSISLHWSLRKAFLSLLAILRNSAFKWVYLSFFLCFSLPFFSQLFVMPPQTAILLFCISFSWGWSWFLSPIQCHEPPSAVHQALYLSDLVP